MGAESSTDLPMSAIDFETYQGLRYTQEVPNSREPSRGPIYVTKPLYVDESKLTLYTNFLTGVAIDNGTRNLYGTRKIVNGQAREYEWITYNQALAYVEAIASGLTKFARLKRGDMVGIFSKNRAEWCLSSHACDRMTYTLVPLYDTLGADAVPYIVNHTELTTIIYATDAVHLCPSTVQPRVRQDHSGRRSGWWSQKMMFDQAYAAKKAARAEGYKTHALWDALVFSKVRQVLGGRIDTMISGSAPLSAEVKEFMAVAFGCDFLEGYGLSETGAVVSAPLRHTPLGAHVGMPLPNLLVRLEDVPEMGYTSNDKPRPRGEIICKGPNVFSGYYKEPEKTAEAIDQDGWFHTGDIGCWNADDPEVAEAWGTSKGLSREDSTAAKLVNDSEFQREVLNDMTRVGKDAQLRGFEFVKKVHFHPDAFSVDAGLITPTFKLKRPQLKTYFQKEIDAMYAAVNK
ncbi:hypothetical protein Poli38472_014925 [Pythium oligandrum]|uniref:AMP-dependent synthetase/ligase domain-containing protein n=1 Tax=Pythium oligandrum TaxID=41045 RepID=A0A8K1C770_PYTOL|nr:hypothetical protein Poli38472_014925 [Pythium oligandrum]|eukprot:TMW57686.1 hypothetical protein Poli38472_014925 [Pythium oligandrum]